MRFAITATENSLNASIDQRFGRCAWFAIYDTQTMACEFIPNPNKEVAEGAGPASVQLIACHNVDKVVSGEFGLKIKPLFDSLKIQMIVIKDSDKTVQNIIETLKQNQPETNKKNS